MGQGTAAHVPPRDRVTQLPNAPGVYRFRDAYDHVLYIGRSISDAASARTGAIHPSGGNGQPRCSLRGRVASWYRQTMGERFQQWYETADVFRPRQGTKRAPLPKERRSLHSASGQAKAIGPVHLTTKVPIMPASLWSGRSQKNW